MDKYKNIPRYKMVDHSIFWSGLLLYSFGGIIASSDSLNIKLCQGIQTLGLVAMFYAGIFLCRLKIDSGYLKTMFFLYFIWLIVIIIRGIGIPFGYSDIKEFLFGINNGGLIYFAPLVLLFPKNLLYIKVLFKYIIFAGVLFLFLCIVFIKKLMVSGQNPLSQGIIESLVDLSIPSAFILLTYLYHTNKRHVISIVTLVITLIFSVIRARRGLIFITSSLIFFSFFLYFIHSRKKIFILFLSVLFLAFAALYASNLYHPEKSRFIGFLYERGNEDTRTNVELFFYDDMKTNDWIAGRGMNGQYFCPDIEENQVTNFRSIIETGYLQLILKGGIISLSLLLLILVPAIVNGIFFSKNVLSKAAGIWIIQFIINLYPQNAVSFNLSYIMLWISVGICYSKEILNLPDSYIRNILKTS